MGYFPGLADREAELATARAKLTGVHLPIAQYQAEWRPQLYNNAPKLTYDRCLHSCQPQNSS